MGAVEALDYLEDAGDGVTTMNGCDDVVHVRLPTCIPDAFVDGPIAEDHDAVLELGNEDEHAGAIARRVKAA
jgi:hypothetical protein